MSNGGLRRLNDWWRYWIGNDTIQAGVLVQAHRAVVHGLRDLRALDEQMVETRSFEDEIADIEGRFKMLETAMVRTARHEFDTRRRLIRAGDRSAVPTGVFGKDAG